MSASRSRRKKAPRNPVLHFSFSFLVSQADLNFFFFFLNFMRLAATDHIDGVVVQSIWRRKKKKVGWKVKLQRTVRVGVLLFA
jgi:hypothetical protein